VRVDIHRSFGLAYVLNQTLYCCGASGSEKLSTIDWNVSCFALWISGVGYQSALMLSCVVG